MMTNSVVLHVGFAHSGTTSLQQNIFSQRPEIFYCGIPYGDLGGIFSSIKYLDFGFDPESIAHEVEVHIRSKAAGAQAIVVSDETFVEQPEVYYTPAMLPVGSIAERLHALFPDARVLFPIRNQFDYVISMYLNLKRNYANLANRPIEPMWEWIAGNQTQVANLFLRNLDYSPAIRTYVQLFGREAVGVVPLELLRQSGPRAYLETIGSHLGIAITEDDAHRFRVSRNQTHDRARRRDRFSVARSGVSPILRTLIGSNRRTDAGGCAHKVPASPTTPSGGTPGVYRKTSGARKHLHRRGVPRAFASLRLPAA